MIRRSTILDLCFGGIALIILSNMNGVLNALTGTTAGFSIFILIFCLIIIYYLWDYKKLGFPHYAFNFTLIWLLVMGGIMWLFYSHMHNPNLDHYRIFRKQAPAIILLYAVYKYIIYAADRGKIINVLYFVTFCMLVVTLFVPLGALTDVFGTGFRRLMYGGGRSAGLFGSPNMAGIHVNFTLAFVLFFTINSKRFFWLFLVCVPLVLYAGFLTFSKAAIITQILILTLFFFYNFSRVFKLESYVQKRFLFSVFIIIGGFIYFSPEIKSYVENLEYQQLERLEQALGLLQGEVNEENTTDRSLLWGKALSLIAANPITGYGTGCFHKLPGLSLNLGSHNTYLMVWGEGGIIAILALLISIISAMYRSIFWIKRPSYSFLAIVIGLVVFIQMYGAAHNGLNNSEITCMVAVLFALIESQKGNIDHLRHGKYVGKDYKFKRAKSNGSIS